MKQGNGMFEGKKRTILVFLCSMLLLLGCSIQAFAAKTVREVNDPAISAPITVGNEEGALYRIDGLQYAPITYGQTLSVSRITYTQIIRLADGLPVEGTLQWEKGESIPAAGSSYQTIVCTVTPPKAVSGNEAAEEAEHTAKMPEIYHIQVNVTVNPAKPAVTWPEVMARPISYGDLLPEKWELNGGNAVFTDPVTQLEQKVDGRFYWEDQEELLPAGDENKGRIVFEPKDLTTYQKVYSDEVKIPVQPRRIGLRLEADDLTPAGGKTARIEVIAEDVGHIRKLNGSITVWVNGKKLEEGIVLSEKKKESDRISAVLEYQWDDGVYEVQAVYVPADSNTKEAESSVIRLTVGERDKKDRDITLTCQDVFYGQEPQILVKAADQDDITITDCVYKGLGKTVYEESSTPPVKPGTYQVTVEIKETEQYKAVGLHQTFEIKRAEPELTLHISPEKITGGGDVKLTVTVRNAADKELLEGLPGIASLTYDKRVTVKEDLQGKDGVYTQIVQVPDKDDQIRCTVTLQKNKFYKEKTGEITIQTYKKQAEQPKPPAEDKKEEPKEDKKKHKEKEPHVLTPEEVEAEFWQDIMFRIYKAQEDGSIVTINAKGHSQMPDKVMEALRTHQKATLALVWEGDMIIIPGALAAPAQKGRVSWTFMELTKLYPLPKPVVQPPAQESKPAEPAKPANNSRPAQKPSDSSDGGSKGSNIIIKTEDEEEESQDVAETVTEEEEAESQSVSVKETETETAAESIEQPAAEKKVDWFLVAVWICAGAGVLAVGVAVTAMLLGQRR